MHKYTFLEKGQRAFSLIFALSLLLTLAAFPIHAAPPGTASIQFSQVVNGEPSTRIEFEITYWDASTSPDCGTYGAITQVVLNNHQRSQTSNVQPASYCLSHTIFSEDTGTYLPGQIDCLSPDGKRRFDFNAGAVSIAAGDKIHCTMSVDTTR